MLWSSRKGKGRVARSVERVALIVVQKDQVDVVQEGVTKSE